jgi:hypothetical protein
MWLSDIQFWIRSARSDAQLQLLFREHDNAQSLDLLYGKRKDPWGLDSPHFRYQQIKYASILSLLPSRRYKRALDLGCVLGNLTRRLCNHADQVLGIDVSHVVWPLLLNFGDQSVGTRGSPQVTTLTNSGASAMNITSINIAGTNRADFTETNNCGTSIPAGGSCNVSVLLSSRRLPAPEKPQ